MASGISRLDPGAVKMGTALTELSSPASSPTVQTGIGSRPRRRRGPFWRFLGFMGWTLLFFLILAAPRAAIIDTPPYVEQTAGIFTEASFLIDTGFDYPRLYGEKHGDYGGPRCYMISVMPTLVAWIALASDSEESKFATLHMINYLGAAIAGAALLSLLRPRLGLFGALFAIAGLATLPLFTTQIEMIGLEIPATAAAALCVLAVEHQRLIAASLAALAAFAVKMSAIVLPAALALYLLMERWNRRAPIALLSQRRFRAGLVAALLVLSLEAAAIVWGDASRAELSFPQDIVLWILSVPDLMVLSLAAIVATLVSTRRRALDRSLAESTHAPDFTLPALTADPAPSAILNPSTDSDRDRSDALLLFSWLVIGISYGLILSTRFEARYLALPCFFLFLVLGLLVGRQSEGSWARRLIFPVVLGFNLLNRNGALLPPLPEDLARSYGIPERSGAYLGDHFSNLAATKILEAAHADTPIITEEQFLPFVKLPLAGYVTQSFEGRFPNYYFETRDANLLKLLEDQPKEIVVARAPSAPLGPPLFPAFHIAPPGPDDEILFEDDQRPPTIIYRHRFEAHTTTNAQMDQYLQFLFANAREFSSPAILIILGQFDLASDYLATYLPDQSGEKARKTALGQVLASTRARVMQDRPPDPAAEAARARLLAVLDRRAAELAGRDDVRFLGTPLTNAEKGLPPWEPQRIQYFRPAPAVPQPEAVLSEPALVRAAVTPETAALPVVLAQASSRGRRESTTGSAGDRGEKRTWRLVLHEGAKADLREVPDDPGTLRATIDATGSGEPWRLQLLHDPVPILAGSSYRITGRARADAPRNIAIAVTQRNAPFKTLGLYETLDLDQEWTPVSLVFKAEGSDPQARFLVNLGGSSAGVEFADLAIEAVDGWTLEMDPRCAAQLTELPDRPDGARVTITALGLGTAWQIQLSRRFPLPPSSSPYFVARFQARAGAGAAARDAGAGKAEATRRGVFCGVVSNRAPFQRRGFLKDLSIGADWESFEIPFELPPRPAGDPADQGENASSAAARESDAIRLYFHLGGETAPFEVSGVEIATTPPPPKPTADASLAANSPDAGAAPDAPPAENPGWYLSVTEGNEARIERGAGLGGQVRVAIARLGGGDVFQIQLLRQRLPIKAGTKYTIALAARADAKRTATLSLIQGQAPFQNLGFFEEIQFDTEWRDLRFDFVASAGDDNATFSVCLGASAVPIELKDFALVESPATDAPRTEPEKEPSTNP